MSGTPKIFSGARAILTINGNLIVYALSVNWSISTEYKPIQGVDTVLPDELAPGSMSVTVTCSMLRVPGSSASVMGIEPTIANFLTQGYSSIQIQDRGTGQVILYVPRAMLVKRTGAVAARQLSSEQWTFVGLGFWDERTPST
jgi:hypothetical protein